MRRDGFTLIELLVVIAIIAILIALLLPGGGGARFETMAAGTVTVGGETWTADGHSPLAGSSVQLHPMTATGFQDPTPQWTGRIDEQGRFEIRTSRCWRKDHASTGPFAVTIDLPDQLAGPCPQHELERFADPRTTPLHVVIKEGETPDFAFDLAER